MKLVSTHCPSCGAELGVNEKLHRATCNYCGHTFLLDDQQYKVELDIQNAKRIGYELECGRIQAMQEADCRNREAISQTAAKLDTYISLYDNVALLAKKAEKWDEKRRKIGEKKNKNTASIAMIVILLLSFYLGIKRVTPGLTMLSLMGIAFIIFRVVKKKLLCSIYEKISKRYANRLATMIDKHGIGAFVDNMLTCDQAQYARNALISGTATSLGDALAMYQKTISIKQREKELKLFERSLDEKEEDRKTLLKSSVAVGAGIFFAARSIEKSMKKG